VEQKELNFFLEENLCTERICPFKSPMAALVFFIKKKDGLLQLVQDYRALNSMTVKNKYPLPLISELVSQLCRARYFTKLDIYWGLTMFALSLETSGRWPSESIEAYLNP